VISGASALIYAARLFEPPSLARSAFKTTTVTALALAVLALGGSPLLIVALALSAVGDFWLSHEGERAFLAGLVSFALAHLAYLALLWQAFALGPLVWAVALPLGVAALSTLWWLVPYAGRLAGPVLVYVALVGGVAFFASGHPMQPWVGLGGLAFATSDFLLGIVHFRLSPDHPMHRPAARFLWALYVAAQWLLVWGLMAS